MKALGQHLDRDVASEFRVAGPVDLAHATRAEQRADLQAVESRARQRRALAAQDRGGHDTGGRCLEEPLCAGRLRQELIHLASDIRVLARGLQVRGALLTREVERCVANLLDATPSVWCHRGCCELSWILERVFRATYSNYFLAVDNAACQLRMTVNGGNVASPAGTIVRKRCPSGMTS